MTPVRPRKKTLVRDDWAYAVASELEWDNDVVAQALRDAHSRGERAAVQAFFDGYNRALAKGKPENRSSADAPVETNMTKHLRKNKAAFIRQCPASMAARDVVQRGLRLHGLTFSEAYVGLIRTRAERTQRRGFKVMDPDLAVDISGIGGIVAHQRGVAHEFSHREAVTAGSKGGLATARNRRLRKEGLLPPLKRKA